MAAKGVHTNRFELGWKSVVRTQGTFNWAPSDRFIGALASRGIRAAPFVWGSPKWVAQQPRAPPARHPRPPARLAELPQGGGRALRARRRLLGHALPPPLRSARHAAAGPLVAGLERAQPEEVLQPGGLGRRRRSRSTRSCCGSPTTRSRAGIAAPRSCSPETPAIRPTGASGHGGSSIASTASPGSSSEFDVAALHPYASTAYDLGQEVQQVHAVMSEARGRGHAPVADRVRLGIGPARPLRHQPGRRRAGEAAARLVQPDPQEPRRLERAAGLLVPVARPGAQLVVRQAVQLLRQRRAAAARPQREARLRRLHQVQRRQGRRRAPSSPRARGRAATPTTPRPPSCSPRATRARPSGAASARTSSSPAARRARSRRSPTAGTGSPQGDRPRRKREPDRVSNLHGRHASPPGAADHRHRPQLARQQQLPKGQGHLRRGAHREALRHGRLQRRPGGRRPRPPVRLPGLIARVADDTTTSFSADAKDAAGNVSSCSAPFTYVENTP